MRILTTCLSESWGGLEMYTLQTIKELLKKEINAELLCSSGSRLHKEAVKENIKVFSVKAAGYFHPIELFKTSKFINSQKYDAIHSNYSKDLWLIVPALKLSSCRTPLLLSKHMGSYIVKKDFLHKLIYSRVNYALAISNVIAKNLFDTTTLTKEKILLLHNGTDTDKFDPNKIDGSKVREEFNIGTNDLLIGMISRFSPGKGHEEFLHMAHYLSKKYDNIKFIIVGEPSKGEDKYYNTIVTLVNKLEIRSRIIFTGFRSDTPELLAAMDIFIFPSHAEAFGIALIEAMSMQKPTVCSNSDGVLDIALDGLTSYLFEKQNWKDLAEKTELLIQSPEKRKSFGEAGRKRAVELFDFEVFTNNLIGIYKKAIR
jgi:glycosyltransferase involved in cell wall biosynthesis